jgi:hypothetical protein
MRSFLLPRIMMSGLLLGMFLLVCNFWFHHLVTSVPWLVSMNFGTGSYQCSLSNCTPICLCVLKCSSAHTPTLYSSFASTGLVDVMLSIALSYFWHSLHLLSASVCSIFVAWYFVCSVWSCAAVISCAVSAFRASWRASGTCLLHQQAV